MKDNEEKNTVQYYTIIWNINATMWLDINLDIKTSDMEVPKRSNIV